MGRCRGIAVYVEQINPCYPTYAGKVLAGADFLRNLVSRLIGVVNDHWKWRSVAIFTVGHLEVQIAVKPYPMPISSAPLKIASQPIELPLGVGVIVPSPRPGIARWVAPSIFIACGARAVVVQIRRKNSAVAV